MRSLLRCRDQIGLVASLQSGADALLIDAAALAGLKLEDDREHGRPALVVMVGALRSGSTDAELDAAMPIGPDAVWLADTVGGRDVQHLAAKLAVREAELGVPDGETRILACLESAAGIFAVGTLAGASGRLGGLTWDPERLARSIAAESSRGADGTLSPPLQHARSTVLFGAAAAGVPGIDAGRGGLNQGRFRTECEAARRDGFRAKLAANPSEVATVNAVFAAAP